MTNVYPSNLRCAQKYTQLRKNTYGNNNPIEFYKQNTVLKARTLCTSEEAGYSSEEFYSFEGLLRNTLK